MWKDTELIPHLLLCHVSPWALAGTVLCMPRSAQACTALVPGSQIQKEGGAASLPPQGPDSACELKHVDRIWPRMQENVSISIFCKGSAVF